MKNLKNKIEAIPAKDFYWIGYDSITFEAYGDEIYYIHNCPDNITDCEKIKAYFLKNLNKIMIE